MYKDKFKVSEFLKEQKLAVISTVGSNSSPESALIAFVEDDELNIYFQTGKDTRKVVNLKNNPKVSLVFGLTLENMVTVQYEGRAERLENLQAIELCKKRFIDKKSPSTAEFLNRPGVVFFKVTPNWISFSDYTDQKPKIIEIIF